MEKKLIKILVFVFIFLLPCINVKAATDYYYKNAYLDISNYKNANSKWNITSTKSHTVTNGRFWIHQAYKGSTYIHAYCLNVGKTADTTKCNTLDEKTFNASNTGLSESKVKLLKELLANSYYYDGNITGNGSTGGKYVGGNKNKILATQILVWEIVEGARTKFDTIAPNIYNGSNSAYNKFVKQSNGVNTEYKAIIEKIQKNTTAASIKGKVFDKSDAYTLTWNGSKYTAVLGDVGKYTKCKSDTDGVSASVSGGNLTVSTKSKLNSAATITCTYSVGSTKTDYDYYDFNCSGSYQDLIRGEAQYTYSQKVKVKTIERNVKIVKTDDSGKEMTGARFTLKCSDSTKCGSDAYTYDLTSASNKTLAVTRSGNYILSEITTPSGRKKIPDTTISISVENGTATVSGGNGLVRSTNGNTITIQVINTSKYFSVIKKNQSGSAVNGATFQIKNSNGSVMKFNWNGTMFVYNVSGTITNIVNDSANIYPIAGLPDGNYSLVEVAVPYPYVLAGSESERTVKFKIKDGDMYLYSSSSKNYFATATSYIEMKNYTTKVVVNKIGKSGVKLSGIGFYLWDSTKTKKIKATMSSSGLYNYNVDQNTGVDSYTTNDNGQIVINALPAGTYYFEEYSTGDTGYPVPEGDDAFTKVEIVVSASGVKVNEQSSNQITISNAKNEFNFYKVDENGKYLTGGKFKIQQYDKKTNKYIDIAISKVASTDSTLDTYKPDPNSDTFIFSINNGIATFVEMSSSTKYRITELEAPDGYEISNVEGDDQLVIEIDSSGYVKSSTTLVNKSTEIEEDAQASAELVINISTGQTRIHYVLIIGILATIITALFIISRKMRKK